MYLKTQVTGKWPQYLSMPHKVPSTELLVYVKHPVLVYAPFSQPFCNLWSTTSFDKTNNAGNGAEGVLLDKLDCC